MTAMIDDPRTGTVATAIRARRLIAILRKVPSSRLLDLVDELVADGLRVFEVTFDAPTAAADLAVVRERAGSGSIVGAGTIRSAGQLSAAIDAGAAFGVSPVLDLAIVAQAAARGLPFVPAAATPTEADAAWRAGAAFVKLFPASSLGPAFVRELRGPLPEIETIATGRIDATNATAFVDAGAVAVGIGSALDRMDPAERRALVAALAAR